MPAEIIAGVVLTVTGLLLLMLTGVNGIRHARLMGLGWDGYLMSSVWIVLALLGSLNLVNSVHLLNAYGRPLALLFDSGHAEPYTFGLRSLGPIVVQFVIVVLLCFRSFVMVRNAKKQSLEQRQVAGELHRAMLKLREARRG